MLRKVSVGLSAAALLLLTACSVSERSHEVVLIERGSGTVGIGALSGSATRPGRFTVTLEGMTLESSWFYVRGKPARLVEAWGLDANAFEVDTLDDPTGAGDVLLAEPGRLNLRCQFRFERGESAGLGVCKAQTGEFYDLFIRQG